MKKISPKQARAYAAMTVASLLAGAACGGAETAEPPATSAAVANTAPSTILPPQTTQPTTTASPAAPTTVPAPPTTSPLSEEDQAKQAVIEAAKNAWYVFNEAKLDPTNEQKFEAAVAAHTGAAQVGVQQLLREYRSSGQRSLESTSQPASITIDPQALVINETAATVEFCRVGSNILVQSGGNPDGTDKVLDDTVNAYRERETYVLVGGVWLNSDVELLAKYENSNTCEPAA